MSQEEEEEEETRIYLSLSLVMARCKPASIDCTSCSEISTIKITNKNSICYLLHKQLRFPANYIPDHHRHRQSPPSNGGDTMSWFNNDVEEDDNNHHRLNNNTTNVSTNQNDNQQVNDVNSPQSPTRGVKEDLSEISRTLTRQFWGVASLIPSNQRSKSFDAEAMDGIRRDFAEIGGRFRSGITKLSNNVDVLGITKLASEFLQMDSEDDDCDSTDGDCDGGVGVTDEVVDFVSDIAVHPETWLEFPLPEDEDDDEEFDLSDAQQEHALAVERLAPRLRALRIELCPGYMCESSFWKIYFVLLHPKLEQDAAELLSTSQIVKARSLLAYELKNRSYSGTMSDSKSKSFPLEVSAIETIKHPIKSEEYVQIVDKSVIQEEPHEGKEDDWLKEESSKIFTNRVAIPIENNEDVSFSDLEDDDDGDDGNIPIHYKKAAHTSDSSTKDTRVQFNRSSTGSGKDSDSLAQVSVHNSVTKQSNDWLDVVNIDVA